MNLKKIVIVGGGVEGWAVASLLGRHLPAKLVDVFVIEHPVPNHMVAESAGSSINNFHNLIGVNEKTLLSASNAIYRMGVIYDGWSSASQRYALSEGEHGDTFRGIDFHQMYIKGQQLGVKFPFDEYSINSVSAKLSRCASAVPNQQSIYSRLTYGFNLQIDRYTNILKENAIAAGVKFVKGKVDGVILQPESGNISAVRLDDGELFTADFFIDCSGKQGVLIGGGLDVAFISRECVFNRAAVGSCMSEAIGNPITNLRMHNDGFLKQIFLRNRSVVAYNFSSHQLDDEGAKRYLNEMGASDISFQDNSCERKTDFWFKNCVAIGSAASSSYDMYYSPLQIVRNSAVRLLDLLIGFDDFESVSVEYNRLSLAEYTHVENLNELHLYLARSQSLVLNEYFTSGDLSESARHALNLFSLTGRLAHVDEDIFTKSEWISFFLGNNVLPKTYSNEVDLFENTVVIEFIQRIKAGIFKAAEKVPRHVDFISSILNG